MKRLPLLVGRAEEARLRVSQDCVSRRHCELVDRDGVVFIRDLKSTNGTLVAGAAIEPEVDVAVPSGAVIKVGGASFRVEYGTGGTTIAAADLPAADKETVPLDGAPSPHVAAAEAPAFEVPITDAPRVNDSDLDEFFKSLS